MIVISSWPIDDNIIAIVSVKNLVSVTNPPIMHGYSKSVSELKAHVVLSVDCFNSSKQSAVKHRS